MSEISSSALSEIICTRISHDLIGNIGAVSNAVELLEDGDMDFLDDIKSILNVSSHVLSARMKFFRMAFGLDSSNLENAEMIVKTCEEYVQTIGNQKKLSDKPAAQTFQCRKIRTLADAGGNGYGGCCC